jgi:transcription antitermination protein NusB
MRTSARKKARELALQALYQWYMASAPVNEVEAQYLAEINSKKIDVEYFSDLFRGVVKSALTIDNIMLPLLDRKITEVNPIEFTILRLAIYELKFRPDIPYKVCINEALELAKKFGSVEGFKYINGILDKIARNLRPHEM